MSGAPRLDGKVAIVVGAGSSGPGVGTGKAISVLYATEGAKVLLMDHVEERANETLAMVEELGGEASVFQADVTKASDCEAAVQAAIDRYGKVDVLVNNIGITRPGSVVDVTEEDWDSLFALDLKAMMLMSKYAIPHMIEGGGGSIVNISSTGALRPPGGHAAYDTAKGGVISLTIGLAVEQGRNGIRTNAIMPGRMVTPMVMNLSRNAGRSDEEQSFNRSTNLLGILGDAWDIAWAAVFLASDEARWITGITVPVDGGFLISSPEVTGVPGVQLREFTPAPLVR